MERQLFAEVPRGSTVNADGRQPLLYIERITEWSTPTMNVVSTPRPGSYVVRFVHSPAGPCTGYALEVTAQ